MSRRPEEAQAVATSNFPPVTELPNTDPQVILAFHGLLSLRFKTPGGPGSGFCEVGMHADAPKHNFTINAFDLMSGSDDPFFTSNFGPAGSATIDKIRFDAVNTDSPLAFFQPAGFQHATATEKRKVGDLLDFRQVTDFESPEFYNRDLTKHDGLFRPRLIVKTGIFVSLLLSQHNFKRQAPFDERKLGAMAEFAAAGIYLKPGGLVALRIGEVEVKPPIKPDPEKNLYLFVFDNSCPPKVCNFNPQSPIKHERNDFFEYYKMFTIPDEGEEFELHLESKNPGGPELPALRQGTEAYHTAAKFLNKIFQKGIDSNNDAPCGPGAFGGGG